MAHINIPPIPSSEITPEPIYLNRRKFMLGLGAAAGAAALAACASPAPAPVAEAPAAATATGGTAAPPTVPVTSRPVASLNAKDAAPAAGSATDELGDKLTDFEAVTTYNNFYEFGVEKGDPARNAGALVTSPWTVQVGGLVGKPKTYGVEDLISQFGLEERIYRHRCVEAWSMVIPWIGFPLRKLLADVEPTGDAKYVRFETLLDPMQMPGQRSPWYDWPYVEGLRLDEAMNDLAILSFGLYGKQLLPQNGAPVRLVLPWKYGFKSIKSIVKIDLVTEQPTSLWMTAAPAEYGFYSNVNPVRNHPRWSQATERRIGDLSRRATLPFNGYADQVASLYAGMDLVKFY